MNYHVLHDPSVYFTKIDESCTKSDDKIHNKSYTMIYHVIYDVPYDVWYFIIIVIRDAITLRRIKINDYNIVKFERIDEFLDTGHPWCFTIVGWPVWKKNSPASCFGASWERSSQQVSRRRYWVLRRHDKHDLYIAHKLVESIFFFFLSFFSVFIASIFELWASEIRNDGIERGWNEKWKD